MKVPVSDFLSQQAPILDVRSPSEFAEGHIPGAVSFPLFSDEQRAQVGTVYKQDGKAKAIKLGFDLIGPKLTDFIEQAEKYKADTFRVHCWRGGMRSDSMAWLMRTAGFKTILLEGGYKAYRNHLIEYFNNKLKINVLTGFTGSKKTLLLEQMARLGEQVVDLEDLANHQGSSFGNQKTSGQPTTGQFQNNLFEAFRGLDPRKPVWIEDECMRIGSVNLVQGLYIQKSISPHYVVKVDKEERLRFLIQEYGGLSKTKLLAATQSISKKLGYDKAQVAREMIENGQIGEAAGIILSYYDRQYEKALNNKRQHIRGTVDANGKSLEEVAHELIELAQHEIQIN